MDDKQGKGEEEDGRESARFSHFSSGFNTNNKDNLITETNYTIANQFIKTIKQTTCSSLANRQITRLTNNGTSSRPPT
jgi:hypothetical protein